MFFNRVTILFGFLADDGAMLYTPILLLICRRADAYVDDIFRKFPG